jgi:hypothetical protein
MNIPIVEIKKNLSNRISGFIFEIFLKKVLVFVYEFFNLYSNVSIVVTFSINEVIYYLKYKQKFQIFHFKYIK